MLIAVRKDKFIVLFDVIFSTLSFPIVPLPLNTKRQKYVYVCVCACVRECVCVWTTCPKHRKQPRWNSRTSLGCFIAMFYCVVSTALKASRSWASAMQIYAYFTSRVTLNWPWGRLEVGHVAGKSGSSAGLSLDECEPLCDCSKTFKVNQIKNCCHFIVKMWKSYRETFKRNLYSVRQKKTIFVCIFSMLDRNWWIFSHTLRNV